MMTTRSRLGCMIRSGKIRAVIVARKGLGPAKMSPEVPDSLVPAPYLREGCSKLALWRLLFNPPVHFRRAENDISSGDHSRRLLCGKRG